MPTHRTRLLLAEDDHLIRMDLQDALQRLGYQVVGDVGDGARAVALARELRPDLVIMCIRMPEMDGLTAARILHDERIAPVMLLSAMCDEELVARACEAGVVMYLTKPARDSDLIPAIEVALARHREACEMERRVSTLEDQLATRRLVERAKGLLMEYQQLSERDAFRQIQRLSMNTRRSMREVAEAILLAETFPLVLPPLPPRSPQPPDPPPAQPAVGPQGAWHAVREEAAAGEEGGEGEAERTQERRAAAERRAEAVLREYLTEAEWEHLTQRGYLEVPSTVAPGRAYRIPRQGGRPQIYEHGRLVAHLCIQPVEPLPPADLVLLHALLIRSDEASYLATANRFPV